MSTQRSNRPGLGASCGVLLALLAVHCELATTFDRSRILDDGANADASSVGAGSDAGTADAAFADADHDGSTLDASVPPPAGPVLTTQVAFIKPSNTTPGIRMSFGGGTDNLTDEPRPPAIALSADGTTLAVGAPGERSSGSGVNGDQTQTADGGAGFARGSGAAYVFVRAADGTWSQQAFVKASDPSAQAGFGTSVQLSADGNTLVVGAVGAATTYVFQRSGGAWAQVFSSTAGWSGALSADGATLIIGTSVHGRVGGVWSLTGMLPSSYFALETLSSDGATFAGSYFLSANEHGVAFSSFSRQASGWVTRGDFAVPDSVNHFSSLVLSADGNTLLGGESGSNACTDACPIGPSAGQVDLFTHTSTGWTSVMSLPDPVPPASASAVSDGFGQTVALGANGSSFAVGAALDMGCNTGIGDAGSTGACSGAGAAYLYARRTDGTWARAFVKASNTRASAFFGTSVALSADGKTLAVGAGGEASGATGVGGDQSDTSAPGTGAVYVFQ